MANPASDADCEDIVRLYNDENGGKGGNAQVGITTIADVRLKHKTMGPKADMCTLRSPPSGIYFLVYLRDHVDANKGSWGTLLGCIGMSFRSEMPCPDIGWMFFGPFQGHGYASEASREALRFWHDVVGVREIFAGTLENNTRSQRLAERIGLIRAGTFDIVFGHSPNESHTKAVAFVLPGMEWKEGLTTRATVGGKPDET